jgi:calcineurin-like phosphoesterase family protein
MAELFFTADWFLSEHNAEEMITLHNESVGPADTVWVLGGVQSRYVPAALEYVRKMNGRKYLIASSDDACWAGHGLSAKELAPVVALYREEAGFTQVVTGTAFAVHPNHRVPIRLPLGGGRGAVDAWPTARSLESSIPEGGTDWRPCARAHGETQPWLIHGGLGDVISLQHREISVSADLWAGEPVHVDDLLALMDGDK